jgi:hypothetical protein
MDMLFKGTYVCREYDIRSSNRHRNLLVDCFSFLSVQASLTVVISRHVAGAG